MKIITATGLSPAIWGELGAIFSNPDNLFTLSDPSPSSEIFRNISNQERPPHIYPTNINHANDFNSFDLTINISEDAPVELVKRLLELIFPEVYLSPVQSE